MNALLLLVVMPGFACAPSGAIVASMPYTGPFVMPLAEAQRRAAGDARYQVMSETDPGFDPKHCPPIY